MVRNFLLMTLILLCFVIVLEVAYLIYLNRTKKTTKKPAVVPINKNTPTPTYSYAEYGDIYFGPEGFKKLEPLDGESSRYELVGRITDGVDKNRDDNYYSFTIGIKKSASDSPLQLKIVTTGVFFASGKRKTNDSSFRLTTLLFSGVEKPFKNLPQLEDFTHFEDELKPGRKVKIQTWFYKTIPDTSQDNCTKSCKNFYELFSSQEYESRMERLYKEFNDSNIPDSKIDYSIPASSILVLTE